MWDLSSPTREGNHTLFSGIGVLTIGLPGKYQGFLILSGGQNVWFLAQGHLARSESVLHPPFLSGCEPVTRLGQHTWIWPSLLQHQAAPPLSSRPLVL